MTLLKRGKALCDVKFSQIEGNGLSGRIELSNGVIS